MGIIETIIKVLKKTQVLNDLDDVFVFAPRDGQVFQYENGYWRNKTLPDTPAPPVEIKNEFTIWLGKGQSVLSRTVSAPTGWTITGNDDIIVRHGLGKICCSCSVVWNKNEIWTCLPYPVENVSSSAGVTVLKGLHSLAGNNQIGIKLNFM